MFHGSRGRRDYLVGTTANRIKRGPCGGPFFVEGGRIMTGAAFAMFGIALLSAATLVVILWAGRWG